MKKFFIDALLKLAVQDKKIFLLTGDLGYNAFEEYQKKLSGRFINAGIAEQNMVTVAAGMAHGGLKPWVYSIAPFLILKTTEQIRNDICHTGKNVKLIGIGGGYGYGVHGPTHHMLEDLAILSSIGGIQIYVPAFDEDISQIVNTMHSKHRPAYLRLGLVKKAAAPFKKYQAVRRILRGDRLSLFVLGPLVHNVVEALSLKNLSAYADVWLITELPFEISADMIKSVQRTKKIMVIEEHSPVGGLGDRLNREFIHSKYNILASCHLSAKGYRSKTFGSQEFHWKENSLHPEGILSHVLQLTG